MVKEHKLKLRAFLCITPYMACRFAHMHWKTFLCITLNMSKLPLLALPFNSNLQVWRKYTAPTSSIRTLYVWNIHAPIAQLSWPPDSLQWIKPFPTDSKIRIPLHRLHANSTFRVPAVHHKNLRCSSKRVCDLLFHIYRLCMKITAPLKSVLHLLTPDPELFCKNCALRFSIIHRPVVVICFLIPWG